MGATFLAARQVARLRPELGPWVRPALRKAGRALFLKPTSCQGLGEAQALSPECGLQEELGLVGGSAPHTPGPGTQVPAEWDGRLVEWDGRNGTAGMGRPEWDGRNGTPLKVKNLNGHNLTHIKDGDPIGPPFCT